MRTYQYDQIEREIAKRRNSALFTAEPPLSRVNPIFTRKPYSADPDLGKLLRKKRRKEKERERYQRRKAKYKEEHGEEGWQKYERQRLNNWRDENRDKLHEQQKRYRAKHADELREKRQAYYEANKERIKQKARERYWRKKGAQDERGRDHE